MVMNVFILSYNNPLTVMLMVINVLIYNNPLSAGYECIYTQLQ